MYAEHFNLSVEPFGLTPDPAFLYLSPGHREALAAVEYGLLARRGFITMVGEVGTGKTTLLYTLLSQMGPEVETAYIANTTQSFEDLLLSVLKDLQVEPADTSKHALIGALNAHLVRRAEENRTVALIIDEAQNLSDRTFEELRLLSNFETYTQKLVQIVLVGQPELADRLSQPSLRQLHERVSVRTCIKPLDRVEMERYIDHRLRRAGGTMQQLFAPRAVNLIVKRAGGIPRRANILCHNALLFSYGRDLPQVTVPIAREVVAGMGERRARFVPRPALRSSRAWQAARWAAIVALGVGAVAMIDRVTSLAVSGASVISGVLTGVPVHGAPLAVTPLAPRKPVDDPAPPAREVPSDPPSAEVREEAPPAMPAQPAQEIRPESRQEPAAAKEPAGEDAPAPFTAGTVTLRVPPGATLWGLLRNVYGQVDRARAEGIIPEILRLNPQLKSADIILAGDLLRMPRP
jgi:general secretion pathway protein A